MLGASRNAVHPYFRGQGLPCCEAEAQPSKLDPTSITRRAT